MPRALAFPRRTRFECRLDEKDRRCNYFFIILVQPEVNLDVDLYGDRTAVLHGGLEAPPVDRFDGFLVEAHAQRTGDFDVSRLAVRPNDQPQNYDSLKLRLTGFFGVFGIGSLQGARSRDSVANVKGAAAESTAMTGTDTRTAT